MKDPHDVIKAPLITEKLSRMAEKANVVAFKVAPDANKIEIRRAVEQIWKVRVEDVRTQNRSGKAKRLGRWVGRRPHWKKAVVKLAEGDAIPDMG